MRAGKLSLWTIMALSLAACSGGSSSGSISPMVEVPIPFQGADASVIYNAASSTVSFTAAGGITATGAPEPADTAGNTITVGTDDSGALVSIILNLATTNGGAPQANNITISNGIGDASLATPLQIALLVNSAMQTGLPQAVYQSVSAGLSYSGFGMWVLGSGGVNYNVGTFALGTETTGPQMAALSGTATYTGNALGFGAAGTVPFTFTSLASMGVNFTTGAVSNLTFSNFSTQDVNDGNPGPAIPTLTGAGGPGTIAGNKYSVAIAGGGLNGSAAGGFYGPAANETAGTFQASGVGVSFIGSYGAHH